MTSVLAPNLSVDIVARARRVGAIAATFAGDVDLHARFPAETVAALKNERLLSIMIPKELGGEGASAAQICEVCAILGQNCASSAMIFAMHQIKLSSLVSHGMDADWHRGFMQQISKDQLLLASATTEGGIGGDLRNSICAVVTNGGDFTLSKDATVISYGSVADAILVTARANPDAPSSDQVMVVALKGQYTLEQTSVWNTLGMRGTCSEGFKFNCTAPVAQILPKPFAEIAAQSMLSASHLFWGALWYGIASEAFNRAQAFVKAAARRAPSVTPPGALRLSEAAVTLQTMRATLKEGVLRYETARKRPDDMSSIAFATAINNVKVAMSQSMLEVIDQSLLICGIMGYKNDTPFSLGRHLRDAHSARLMISNDRILLNTSNLLLMARADSSILGL